MSVTVDMSLSRFLKHYRLLYHSGEAHEGHGKDAGCHKGDRNAAERLWNLVQGNLLTQAGKEDHGQSETEG